MFTIRSLRIVTASGLAAVVVAIGAATASAASFNLPGLSADQNTKSGDIQLARNGDDYWRRAQRQIDENERRKRLGAQRAYEEQKRRQAEQRPARPQAAPQRSPRPSYTPPPRTTPSRVAPMPRPAPRVAPPPPRPQVAPRPAPRPAYTPPPRPAPRVAPPPRPAPRPAPPPPPPRRGR
jgi:hypothetical protein